jgi:hypothetical protein
MAHPIQSEFDFQRAGKDGLLLWREEFRKQQRKLARELNMPLGREVEVWLRDGLRLRGELRFADPLLLPAQCTLENTKFEVGGVAFAFAEMEGCVSL